MFPGATGFSVTNLKYMKRWYQFYSELVMNRQQPADDWPRERVLIRQQPADPLGVATYQLRQVVDRTVAEIEQRKSKKLTDDGK